MKIKLTAYQEKLVKNISFLLNSSVVTGLVVDAQFFDYDTNVCITFMLFVLWIVYTLWKSKKKEKDIIISALIFWGVGFLLLRLALETKSYTAREIFGTAYRAPLFGLEMISYDLNLFYMINLILYLTPVVVICISYYIGRFFYKKNHSK